MTEWRYAAHTTNRLPWEAKAIALHLSCLMNSAGFCWVSAETLSERSGVGRSTVFGAIRVLRKRGWVKVGKRRIAPGIGGLVNTYQATFPSWYSATVAKDTFTDAFGRRVEGVGDPAF